MTKLGYQNSKNPELIIKTIGMDDYTGDMTVYDQAPKFQINRPSGGIPANG